MFLNKQVFNKEYIEEVKRLTRVVEEDFQPHMFIAIVLGGKLYHHNYHILYFLIPIVLVALYDKKKKKGLKFNTESIVNTSVRIGLLIIFYGLCFLTMYFKNKTFIMQYAIFLPFYMYSYYKSCRSNKDISTSYSHGLKSQEKRLLTK